MFEQLDFIYLPSHDVAADIEHYTDGLGGEVVFAIERFDTRVAMVRIAPEGPALLLAEHLEGEQPILVFRVESLEAAKADLRERGVELAADFEMPYGHGAEIRSAGPQRVAVYEATRRERGESLAGRRDF